MSEVTGVVINQSPGKQTNVIQSGDDIFIISPYSRIKGAGGHGCYVEVGDTLKFERPELGQKILRAYFANPPEITLPEEETAEVTQIVGELIFGARDCGCTILISTRFKHPDLKIGDRVRYKLTIDRTGMPRAINVKLEEPAIAAKEEL
jgi:hypothetical protein